MRRWVIRLLLLATLALVVRAIIEAEEGSLTTVGERTAKFVRDAGPGASERTAQGVEAASGLAERGANSARRLARRTPPVDGNGDLPDQVAQPS